MHGSTTERSDAQIGTSVLFSVGVLYFVPLYGFKMVSRTNIDLSSNTVH